jgi:hypothetical protein
LYIYTDYNAICVRFDGILGCVYTDASGCRDSMATQGHYHLPNEALETYIPQSWLGTSATTLHQMG